MVFAPTCVAQFLHVGVRGARSISRNLFHVFKKDALGRRQASFVEFPFEYCSYALIGGSLNTQEVGVRVQSIGALVQVADVTRDHFFSPAIEVAR